jgi:5'-deoxynucleotidase YfbR-like HD superfamily hydrolase
MIKEESFINAPSFLKKPDILETERTIRTFTGQYVDVFFPDINTITIEDIAHGLARQCRFSGHTINYYTVAQHSIWVALRLPKHLQLEGLLHDASEAFCVDIPSPIKKHFTQYHTIEDNVMKVIAQKFNIQYPFHSEIKIVDKEALYWEWNNKVLKDVSEEDNWSPKELKDVSEEDNWSPKEAERKFLELYYQLI